MEYLLDTANIEEIKYYCKYLPISGVTSNPTIVKKEGKIDFFAHMREIREIIGMDKTLHIQVSAKDYDGMIADAEAILRNVDDKVYIKVPANMEGIRVIKELKSRGVNITATAVYSKSQSFMALEAGADYIAPYYNRMEAMGIDSCDVISSIAEIIDVYGYNTKILAASFKNTAQIDKAILSGAHSITSAPSIFKDSLSMKIVEDAVDVFCDDWKEVYGDNLISQL